MHAAAGEPADLVWRPVWLYPSESERDPANALAPQHEHLTDSIAANLMQS